ATVGSGLARSDELSVLIRFRDPRRVSMLRTIVRRLAAAALLALAVPGAWAQQTAFTYQGSLLYEGEPYTGPADYEFRLWNAESGGSPAGDPLERFGVEVSEGLFQSELDFGSESLSGDRWLSIAVRTPAWDGQGPAPAFTPLPGRQRVSGSPYSIRTRGIFVNDAGDRVGIGTTEPLVMLHVAGAMRADGGVQFL